MAYNTKAMHFTVYLKTSWKTRALGSQRFKAGQRSSEQLRYKPREPVIGTDNSSNFPLAHWCFNSLTSTISFFAVMTTSFYWKSHITCWLLVNLILLALFPPLDTSINLVDLFRLKVCHESILRVVDVYVAIYRYLTFIFTSDQVST